MNSTVEKVSGSGSGPGSGPGSGSRSGSRSGSGPGSGSGSRSGSGPGSGSGSGSGSGPGSGPGSRSGSRSGSGSGSGSGSPSSYELRALHDINRWKHPAPESGMLARLGQWARTPFEVAGELARKIPFAEAAVEKTVGGVLSLVNDAAQWSVRSGVIHEEYRKAGYPVWRSEDILLLDLRAVDEVIGYLSAKYKTLSAAEGAATGAGGALGIPADVISLLGLNLRAVGEYGAYCGFDPSLQQERLFAMQVLALASSPSDASKAVVMAELAKIGGQIARKKSWKHLEEHAFVRAMQQVAKALGRRLSKAKLAQLLPAAGAVVGGGFNAYYTGKVCNAAHHLYRERFLAGKYGPEAAGMVEVVKR